MRGQQLLDGMGRVRLYPEREKCTLCGKAILRPSNAKQDVCKKCEEIMPLDEIWM